MGNGPFLSWSEVEALVAGFESQSLLGEDDWTHRDHLATAAYYCICVPEEAEVRMRVGIQKLNAARGVVQTPTGGYHETLTVVWTRLIGSHVRSLADSDRVEQVNSVISQFADKQAPLAHYSRERILSQEARYGWLAPDLAALP